MSAQSFPFNNIMLQLMDVIRNNYYFDKEVFLRELIFNAADALEKIRYKALNGYPIDKEPNFCIKIIPNKNNKTLTVLDTGIGMTRKELIDKLGSLVRPGAQAFIDAIQSGSDILKMGEFTVGFYSVFLVADSVAVISKSDDEDRQYRWELTCGDTYTVSDDNWNPDQLTRGTKVVLHLKEDCLEFLEEKRLREVINKHSECVNFPIELQVWEQLNRAKPIWTKRPETVTKNEYSRFYKSLTNDREGYLGCKHFTAEGKLEFSGILYIPKRAPFKPFGVKKSIRLYVRRVFMMDDCEELIPEYLGFVRGVVDSEDLPLNVSAEELRKNEILASMRHIIAKKVLELIEELSEDPERYYAFYEQYSNDIKLGVYEDAENRAKLSQFLRFYTSESGNAQISLKEYVSRMKVGQKHIYYLTGKSREEVASSPFLGRVHDKGYEVIYMVDPLDTCVIQQVYEFNGKKLRDCGRKEVEFAVRRDEVNRAHKLHQEELAEQAEAQEPTAV